MVKIVHALNKLKKTKILVVGDMMIDAYSIGKAHRMSPEAPVAIVNVLHEENKPGGAGNVILNLVSLGADVIAMGRVGKDLSGEILRSTLQQEQVDTRFLLEEMNYTTPVKKRVIADNQQIVRLDYEQVVPLSEHLEEVVISQLSNILTEVQMVAISDYGKGFLTEVLLNEIISQATQQKIPVIIDPKGSEFKKYKGCTFIKPNLKEAYAAAKLSLHKPIGDVARIVLAECEAEWLMITRSEEGISLFGKNGERSDFPVLSKEVKDVTGAGDTVLAVLAYAKANGLSNEESIHLCNIAAGIAIERIGCARVSLSDIACRLFEQREKEKVFDSDHLFLIQEFLKNRSFAVCDASQEKEFSLDLLKRIKQRAKDAETVVVCIDEAKGKEPLIDILSSIREVDIIFVCPDSSKTLCRNVSSSCLEERISLENLRIFSKNCNEQLFLRK